ncbi:hypothetical protein OG607_26635 [Streptomyces sp. NBC_01537]|uniref:hypothetical protein n=1 Tax=Streptomyces sp. NBC_01537 TaxID=2903896 RepID=UPI00386CCF21
MRSQPGLLNAPLHRTPGDGTMLIDLADRQSPAALREAVCTPEFAAIAADYAPGPSARGSC